ncbi:MAG: DUF2520 domain-containing protein, partial [Limnochordales bacterium]
ILAVPDGALAEVAHDLASAGPAPRGCAALHLAGALSTDVLAPLHLAGFAIGSMHPLQTVADPWSGGDRLIGAAFALGGEPAAVAAGRRLVSALRGRALVVPPALRPLYHAAAIFASNYVVTLVAVAARLLSRAGVPEDDAVRATLPLIRGALDNLEHLGFAASLTGPIVRGDVDIVRLHLGRLSSEERSLYCALGRATLELARLAGVKPEARFVILHAENDYTTNIPLEDCLRDECLLAFRHNGADLTPEHGWPLRAVIPHLYFWKSAKWVRGVEFSRVDKPGFWEQRGYHNYGDPWKNGGQRFWFD